MNLLSSFWQSRYGHGFRSRAEVEAHQARGLARLRRKVMPLSPFHARFADRPLAEWPLMDRQSLDREFTRINTRNLSRELVMRLALDAEHRRDFAPMLGSLAVGLSGGSADGGAEGPRALILTAPRERALWLATMAGRFWPSPLLARQRIGFFLHAGNALYERPANPLLQLRFYDLLDRIDAHLPALAAQAPTVLIAPAHVLCQLAEAQRAGAIGLAPRRIISTAEVLSPEDAALISGAFGRPVDQIYHRAEGMMGQTCRAGSLHLNERFLHIDREVIDETTGAFRPIVTDFTREALPILRHRLDDVLIPDPEPCPCGCASLRLKRIEGRAADILWWQGLDGGCRMVPSDALREAIMSLPVRDYRAIQQGGTLTIWLDSPQFAVAETGLRMALAQLASRQRCRLPSLGIRPGLPATAPGEKRRRVIALPDVPRIRQTA